MSTRNYLPMQQKYNRVVLLIDMDCFYCQVEEKLNPELKGQPLAVVQYNAWRGGGIIAVNYAARAKGVTRHMRGDEAKEHCPEIQLVRVPNIREKADLGKYRDAGKEVANVLQNFTPLLERASVDEAYLDITEAVNKRLGDMNAGSFSLQPQALINTYAVGYAGIGDYLNIITKDMNNPNTQLDIDMGLDMYAFLQPHDTTTADSSDVRQSDLRLIVGAAIAGEIRTAVKTQTGYECSAGIAHNKILAKLACGMNKPNKQTILPLTQISQLFETLPVGKIRGLGGKFGEEICECLQIRYLGELLPYSEQELQRKFDEKNGTFLYNICRGIDLEAVTPRFYSKSIGCCKKFPGRNQITGLNTLRHWLSELANEVHERMEKDMLENNRRAKQMVVSFIQEIDGEEISSSRSAPLNGYDQETLIKSSLEVLQANTKQFYKTGSTLILHNPIKFLGISVGKFETIQSGQGKLQEMFANLSAKRKQRESENGGDNVRVEVDDVVINTADRSGTQSIEGAVVAKKKNTFMENFLRRGSEESERAVELINSKLHNETSVGNEVCLNEREHSIESGLESLTDAAQAITKERRSTSVLPKNDAQDCGVKATADSTPEARSFFLNALKKQRANEKQSANTINDDAVQGRNRALNVIESKRGDITKSFFAKILGQTNGIAAAQILDVTSKNNTECKAHSHSSNGLNEQPHNKEAQATELSFIANHNSTNANTNKNKRKYNELLDGVATTTTQQKETASIMPSTLARRQAATTAAPYEASYAEYAVPELREELLQMTPCEICKAKIPNDKRSLQLHQDHHIAMQLSQQLRDEYRKEMKTTKNNTATIDAAIAPLEHASNKKSKKSPKQLQQQQRGTKAGANIAKFLKPTTTTTTTPIYPCHTTSSSAMESTSVAVSSNCDVTDATTSTVICEECSTPVATSEMQQHKDFHVAKTLQRQLNLLEVRTVTVTTAKKPSNNSTLNRTQSNSINKVKPITQFFSQSNC